MKRQVLKKLDDVMDWFFDIKTPAIISFDTETTCLDYLTQEIVGISFSTGLQTCYIDLIDNPEKPQILSFLKDLFSQKISLLIAQNVSYDLKVLKKYGIKLHPETKLFCTQIAAHLIDENLPKNLNFLVEKYFHIVLKKWNDVKTNGFHSQVFYNYGMDDAYYAFELYKVQYPLLQNNNLLDLFFNVEMPFQYVKVDLETNGILIDKEKLNQLQLELKQIIWDLKIKMAQEAGIEYFINTDLLGEKELMININFNSSQQLVSFITNKLGLKIETKTDAGNLSVGKESLKKLKGQHPFIELLRAYNSAETLYNSYVLPFPEYIGSDGRVRCNWHSTVAVTGRVTASKPGLAKLPRANDDIQIPFEFRSCFIAPEGKKIVVGDYAGQELCWLGEVTQDKNLINDIKNGVDIHLAVAKRIFDLNFHSDCLIKNNPEYPEIKTIYKKERYRAKNGVVFPVIYGKTAYGIAKEFGISKEEAKSWMDGLFSLYPDIKKSIAACHRQIDETGEVVNWFGRIRRFGLRLDSSDKYRAYRQGFNFLIQGPSAEGIKKAATRIKNYTENRNWNVKIILMVYDELVLEVDEWAAELLAESMKWIMENCIKTSVLFTVDYGIGDSYASAKQ